MRKGISRLTINFIAPHNGNRGHLLFGLSSLTLRKINFLTLAITFEPQSIEISYMTCMLH